MGTLTVRHQGLLELTMFSLFVTIFIISNILILLTIRHFKIHPLTNKLYPAIWSNQSIIAVLLIILIIQMNIYAYYDRNVFLIIVYLSFFSSVLFSTALVLKLIKWFRYHRNYIVLLYGIAFSLLIVKFMTGSVYVSAEVLTHNPVVVATETREMIMGLSNINATLNSTLNDAYDYISVLSYIMIWIVTILLLRDYSEKFGRIKYWILVSIPLVYYLAEDRVLLLTPFNMMVLAEPVLFGIVHTIFFSAVQLVGGLLFGVAFFVVAKRINQENISTSLKVSGIGIIILVGSNEIFGVYVGAYPPFGLVSVSFMPLACYLLFAGILSSAVLIANNLRIRSELQKARRRSSNAI